MSYETTEQHKGITRPLSRPVVRASPTWEQICHNDERTAQKLAWDYFGEIEELFSHVDDAMVNGQLNPAMTGDLLDELVRKRRDFVADVEKGWERMQEQGFIDLGKYNS